MKKKVYVASSWRNEHQQALVNELRLILGKILNDDTLELAIKKQKLLL